MKQKQSEALQNALNRVRLFKIEREEFENRFASALDNDIAYKRLKSLHDQNSAPNFSYGMNGGLELMARLGSPEQRKFNWARRLMVSRRNKLYQQCKKEMSN